MEVVELKFLLALLGHSPHYRVALADLRPTDNRSDRNRACRQLCDRGLVGCSERIIQFKTSPSGQSVLALDTSTLPLSATDLKLLKKGADGWMTPGKALKGTGAEERQTLLRSLHTRGLIQANAKTQDVWLTAAGRAYLRQECLPQGNHTISFNFLSNYLQFLRAELGAGQRSPSPIPPWDQSMPPQPEDILTLIQILDRELGTNNYLPIFHLRATVQPPLSRQQLDNVLYQLQRQDKIELSSLQDAIAYTPDQLSAGIPQEIGGPLFFISTYSGA